MRVSFAVIETLVKETFSRTCETLTCTDCPFRQAGYKFRKKCNDLNVYEILAWMEFTAQPYEALENIYSDIMKAMKKLEDPA